MNTLLLKLAGWLGLLVAVFQAAISFSPPVSRYLGAGEELVSNPPLPLSHRTARPNAGTPRRESVSGQS